MKRERRMREDEEEEEKREMEVGSWRLEDGRKMEGKMERRRRLKKRRDLCCIGITSTHTSPFLREISHGILQLVAW